MPGKHCETRILVARLPTFGSIVARADGGIYRSQHHCRGQVILVGILGTKCLTNLLAPVTIMIGRGVGEDMCDL
jgi:hypothetical protein